MTSSDEQNSSSDHSIDDRDLRTLRAGLRATVEAGDDSVRHDGPWTFWSREILTADGQRTGHREACAEHDHLTGTAVVPDELADIVIDEIGERLLDDGGSEVRADGGECSSHQSSRESVVERLQGCDFVDDVGPCGPGVLFAYGGSGNHTFTNMMESHRWYLAHYDDRSQKGVFMPVPGGGD